MQFDYKCTNENTEIHAIEIHALHVFSCRNTCKCKKCNLGNHFKNDAKIIG